MIDRVSRQEGRKWGTWTTPMTCLALTDCCIQKPQDILPSSTQGPFSKTAHMLNKQVIIHCMGVESYGVRFFQWDLIRSQNNKIATKKISNTFFNSLGSLKKLGENWDIFGAEGYVRICKVTSLVSGGKFPSKFPFKESL